MSSPSIDHYARARDTWRILTRLAQKGETITYGDLGDRVGIHHRAVVHPLDLIQRYCMEHDLPPLTIIVVSAARHEPGNGFIAHDRDDITAGINSVWAYNWNTLVNPFDEGAQFVVNARYARADVFRFLRIDPAPTGGDWFTGYTKHGDDYYVFCGVGVAGRTGHNQNNYFDGPDLIWHGKPRSTLAWPTSQALLNCPGKVHIFYRTDNRDAFTYAGAGIPRDVKDGPPIEVRWVFTSRRVTPSEQLPEELPLQDGLIEGAKVTITVNAYERNPAARARCIKHWGTRCVVCDFDFAETYGPELGSGFIHVHHLKPLSEIGEQYELNPEEDLRPVCPNCHAMLHRRMPALTLEELKNERNATKN